MLKRLPQHPATESTLREAGAILEQDITELDTEASLASTVAVQLSLFIAGVAGARALVAEQVIPDAVAGLSIGAFAAAVVCESLTFADGMAVVKQRAELMGKSFPSGYGMAAIVGLTEKKVNDLVNKFHDESAPIFVSNVNAPTQIIISGSVQGMEKVMDKALKSGARKAERLNVAVPPHCPLFQSVSETLQRALDNLDVQNPRIPYISNVRGRRLRTAHSVAADLAENIANGVRWYDSISLLVELGTDMFVEMNPGNVLSRLGAEEFPQLRFIALEDNSLAYVSRLHSTT